MQLIPAGSEAEVDPRYCPAVHASGSVLHVNAGNGTFDLAPDQYVWMLRSWKGSRINFPIRCVVKDSPCWGSRKPAPKAGAMVSITGYLMGTITNQQNQVEQFLVELEKVSFLGKGPVSPNGTGISPSSKSLG